MVQKPVHQELDYNSPEPPWGLKGTMLFIASLTVLSGAIIAPSLPGITHHLIEQGLSTDAANFWGRMLISIPAIFIMACSPIVGYIIDKYSRMMALKVGLVIFAVTGVLGGIHTTLPVLIISRIGLGIAVALTMVTSVTLVSDYFKGEARAKFFGIFSSSLSFGGIVYFMMGGFVASIHWRGPFFIYLISIPALFLALKYLYEPERHTENYIHEQGDTLPKARIFMLYLTSVMHMGIYFAIPIQLPFALADQGLSNPMAVALATSCCSAGVIITSINYARIRHHFSMPMMYALGFFFVGLGYVAVFFNHAFVYICLSLFASGLGLGFILPNNVAWIMSITPAVYRGRVTGGLSSSINLGQFLSPLISFSVVDAFSSRSVFFMFSILAMLVSLYYLGYNQFRKN